MDTRQQNLQTSHVSATKRKVDIRQRNSLQIKLQFKHPICKKRWFADALGLKFGPASNPILDWDSKRQKKNTKCRWRESGCVLSRRESCSSGSFGHLRPPSIGPDLTCRRSVRLNSLALRSTLWAFWSFCCIPVFVGSLSWWGATDCRVLLPWGGVLGLQLCLGGWFDSNGIHMPDMTNNAQVFLERIVHFELYNR